MFQVKNYLEKNEPHVNKAAFGVSSQKKMEKEFQIFDRERGSKTWMFYDREIIVDTLLKSSDCGSVQFLYLFLRGIPRETFSDVQVTLSSSRLIRL